MTASTVFPIAIPAARGKGAPVNIEPASTPKVIPGHNEGPNKSRTAIAIPVGGQTGEVFACTYAIINPTRAAKW